MSNFRTPENIEIASLRKKQTEHFDPMAHGTGTPWEDRATHGTLGAFLKTCIASLFGIGPLTISIRRPNTIDDARPFLIGCSILWGLSAAMHTALSFYFADTTKYLPADPNNIAIYIVLAAAGGGFGVFYLFKIYTAIYGRLIAQEKEARLMPDVLLYNVNAYALGPSLLSLIPIAGPPLALVWIFLDMMNVGVRRLRLRSTAALIDAILSLAAVLGITLVAWVVIDLGVLGHHGLDLHPLIPKAVHVDYIK